MRVSHICGNIKLGKKASRVHFGYSTVILSDVNRPEIIVQKWISQVKMSRRFSLWCPRPTVNLLRKSQFLTSWTRVCFFMTCTPSAVCLHTSLHMMATKWSPQNLMLDGAKLFLRKTEFSEWKQSQGQPYVQTDLLFFSSGCRYIMVLEFAAPWDSQS